MKNIKQTDIKFINIAKACTIYGIGRTYCYRLLSEGHIKAKKLGGRTLISAESLNQYFNTLPDYKSGTAI
ncbi:helix-turn-helix domain-containing protein [Acetobacter conturbans]|uniref:helix-turn-helix domain-containing protein n=1 Tax=Acetobacter conturbans TaxID=1737472 RepID=UPI0030CEAC9B